MKKVYLFALMAALAFTGCNNSDNPIPPVDPGPLAFTAAMTTAFSGGQVNGVTYSGGKFVAVGTDGSSDGVIVYSNRRE